MNTLDAAMAAGAVGGVSSSSAAASASSSLPHSTVRRCSPISSLSDRSLLSLHASMYSSVLVGVSDSFRLFDSIRRLPLSPDESTQLDTIETRMQQIQQCAEREKKQAKETKGERKEEGRAAPSASSSSSSSSPPVGPIVCLASLVTATRELTPLIGRIVPRALAQGRTDLNQHVALVAGEMAQLTSAAAQHSLSAASDAVELNSTQRLFESTATIDRLTRKITQLEAQLMIERQQTSSLTDELVIARAHAIAAAAACGAFQQLMPPAAPAAGSRRNENLKRIAELTKQVEHETTKRLAAEAALEENRREETRRRQAEDETEAQVLTAAAPTGTASHSYPPPQPLPISIHGCFPPIWPQLPISHRDGDLTFPALPDPSRLAAPVRRNGTQVKVMYLTPLWCHHGNDIAKEVSYLDSAGDVMQLIGEGNMRRIYDDPKQRREAMIEYDAAEATYSMPEQSALNLYFRYAIRDRVGRPVFDIETARLHLIEELSDEWEYFSSTRSVLPAASKEALAKLQCDFATHLLRRPTGCSATERRHLQEFFRSMMAADVCIMPPMFQLMPRYTTREWYRRMRAMQQISGCTFYPLLEVEERMAHRNEYLQYLAQTTNRYVTLEEKVRLAAARADEHDESLYDVPMVVDTPIAASSSAAAAASSAPAAAPASSSTAATGRARWRDRIEYVHVPHNGLLPPTIFLPDSRSVLRLSASDRVSLVRDLLSILRGEVSSGGWSTPADRPTWVLKGVITTDSHAVEPYNTEEQIVASMVRNGSEIPNSAVPQPGFLLQPYLLGLDWETHLFFARGEFLFQSMTKHENRSVGGEVIGMRVIETRQGWMCWVDNHSQSDKRDTGAYMHDGSENRDSPSILCTFLVLDCQRPEWSAVRPQCIDFCCHILSLLESHCQLVSRSPLIRLDVGAEFKACSRMSSVDGAAVVAAAESSLIAIQQRPEQWQRSGAGFIVRFFLKKANSGLDVNLYSANTNFPIVLTTAREITKQIMEIMQNRQQADTWK